MYIYIYSHGESKFAPRIKKLYAPKIKITGWN